MGRFILQRSKEGENLLVLTDTENRLVCRFEYGKFNETQNFTMLDDCKVDAKQLAVIMREFGEYLLSNHYFCAMPYNDELCRVYLSKLLQNARKERDLTVYQLAQMSNVQAINIHRLEKGVYSARFDTIMRLLTAMKIDISLL